MMKSVRTNLGQGTTELALLLPMLFLLFFGSVQLIIYLQSATMAQYGAFTAARAFQVYGDRTLKSIDYRKLAAPPYTNETQTIAEAAAESVIFESLMWEHRRIKVLDNTKYFNRVYEDANNTSHNTDFSETSTGVVRVNFKCSGSNCDSGSGVDVMYCMPVVFPGADYLFDTVKKDNPCKVTQGNRSYSGVAIVETMEFGREPVEK